MTGTVVAAMLLDDIVAAVVISAVLRREPADMDVASEEIGELFSTPDPLAVLLEPEENP